MAVTKWGEGPAEPDPLRGFRNEVDRLFDQFFRAPPPRRAGQWFSPAESGFPVSVDVEETDEAFILCADVPGVASDALDVSITERRVTIRGERKEPEESPGTIHRCSEIPHGPFRRVVDLPAPIIPEEARGKVEDGLLNLVLPKVQRAERKIIRVTIG